MFVIYAIDAKLQGKKYTPYLFLFLGVMFHYATLLYVFCFLMLELKLASKQLVSFWFACLISAALGLTRELAPWVASALVGDNSYFMSYIDSTVDSDYVLGFRVQFVIFSALPIAYYYLSCPFVTETQGNTYIFRLYLAMNILYLFTTSLPFSDRFALASWLLIPFMINLEFLQAIQAQRKLMGIAAIFASIVFSYYLLT